MTALIGFALLLVVSYLAYLDGRKALGSRGTRNPVLRRLGSDLDPDKLDLDRLRRDMEATDDDNTLTDDTAAGTAATADNPAEAREAALTRQLLAGTIEPSAYQQRMGELARTRTETGGPR